jgi:fimbrial chaperone protein
MRLIIGDQAPPPTRREYLRLRRLIALIIVLFWAASAVSWAYTLSPQMMQLETSGEHSSGFFYLDNQGATPVAIELTIHTHHKDIMGKSLIGQPADPDFLIYPPQLVMMPHEQTTVQIKWIGAASIAAEQAFSIQTHQVAIPTTAGSTPQGVTVGVTVLMNYEGRVYVTPPQARPQVVVESVLARPARTAEVSPSGQVLDVILLNQGLAYQDLSLLQIQLKPTAAAICSKANTCVTQAANTLPNTKSHLLSGDRRHLVIALPTALISTAQTIEVSLHAK